MLTFEYPIRPFTFGPRSSPFFAMPYLAVGGVGPWAWGWGSGPLGAATRCPRRRRPFHFFSRLGLFWRFGTSGFWASRTDDDDETGLPPLNPLVLRTENRQNFIANFFWAISKTGFGRNIPISNVRYALNSPFACDKGRLAS